MPVTLTHFVRPAETLMVIEPVDGGRTLQLYDFDAEEIQRQGGDPIFAKVERPHRKTAWVWVGHDPHERRLDLIIDRWAINGSVREEYDTIRSWQGDPDQGVGPPRLRIRWGMWQQQLWQVEAMKWGPMQTRRDGHPVAIHVVIDFVEAVTATAELSAAEQADAATTPAGAGAVAGLGRFVRGGPRIYVVQPGDTLSGIAAAELGDWERWPEIADLNGIPRGTALIIAGQELRLP